MLRAQDYYGLKGFLMLLAGLAAGFVTVQVKQRIVRSLQTVEERNAVRGQWTDAAALGHVHIRGREETVEIFILAT
jgi:hypothetical protein